MDLFERGGSGKLRRGDYKIFFLSTFGFFFFFYNKFVADRELFFGGGSRDALCWEGGPQAPVFFCEKILAFLGKGAKLSKRPGKKENKNK